VRKYFGDGTHLLRNDGVLVWREAAALVQGVIRLYGAVLGEGPWGSRCDGCSAIGALMR
jgi:hypothetical protein